MHLKAEVIRVLEREKTMSETVIGRLQERCRLLEQEYGWPTTEFLSKFNAGKIKDKHKFFIWYGPGGGCQGLGSNSRFRIINIRQLA
jgi:hypothetical protein